MNIYIICPVRGLKPSQEIDIREYIMELEENAHSVHSWLNVNQTTKAYNIAMAHLEAMKKCDEVHIFWESSSGGSHVDLGMAMAFYKPIKLIKLFSKETKKKSYLDVIKRIEVVGYQHA